MKRAAVIGVVLALLGAGSASANGLLTTSQATNAMRHWSLAHGMERAEVKRCWRLTPDRVRCQMVETGWWNEEGLWANEAWSIYIAHRDPGEIRVVWQDFVIDWSS